MVKTLLVLVLVLVAVLVSGCGGKSASERKKEAYRAGYSCALANPNVQSMRLPGAIAYCARNVRLAGGHTAPFDSFAAGVGAAWRKFR